MLWGNASGLDSSLAPGLSWGLRGEILGQSALCRDRSHVCRLRVQGALLLHALQLRLQQAAAQEAAQQLQLQQAAVQEARRLACTPEYQARA